MGRHWCRSRRVPKVVVRFWFHRQREKPTEVPWRRAYSACLARVSGSKPPVTFLDELVDWALLAPDELFLPNAGFDVYSAVVRQLGPYGIGAHPTPALLTG